MSSSSPQDRSITRREFVERSVAGAAALLGPAGALAAAQTPKETPKESPEGKPPRRTAVDRVTLGKSGLRPTRLGIGTGSQSGNVQRELGQEGFTRLIRHAWDRGIRFIDTADMYKIHDMVGKAIKGLPREELFLQTKIMWETEPDVASTLDRFRKEVGVDYFDTCLIHCAQHARWPDSLKKMRDALSAAKEKGIIRAHGVSCHGLPALREVAGCEWVDINLARINHAGMRMDGKTSDWNAKGMVDEATAEIEKIHGAGKGVIGMKLIGNGEFTDAEAREKAARFVLSRPYVDAVIAGFASTAELDETIERIDRALAV